MIVRNGQKLGSILREEIEPGQAEPTGYEAETVATLRSLLAERGLPTTGNKAELVTRLEESDSAPADGDETDTTDDDAHAAE